MDDPPSLVRFPRACTNREQVALAPTLRQRVGVSRCSGPPSFARPAGELRLAENESEPHESREPEQGEDRVSLHLRGVVSVLSSSSRRALKSAQRCSSEETSRSSSASCARSSRSRFCTCSTVARSGARISLFDSWACLICRVNGASAELRVCDLLPHAAQLLRQRGKASFLQREPCGDELRPNGVFGGAVRAPPEAPAFRQGDRRCWRDAPAGPKRSTRELSPARRRR